VVKSVLMNACLKKEKTVSNKLKTHPFKMRGENMTRIETFVAAAFAFAVTMLVISIGTVPQTMQNFVDATKQIPALLRAALWLCGFGMPMRCGAGVMV